MTKGNFGGTYPNKQRVNDHILFVLLTMCPPFLLYFHLGPSSLFYFQAPTHQNETGKPM